MTAQRFNGFVGGAVLIPGSGAGPGGFPVVFGSGIDPLGTVFELVGFGDADAAQTPEVIADELGKFELERADGFEIGHHVGGVPGVILTIVVGKKCGLGVHAVFEAVAAGALAAFGTGWPGRGLGILLVPLLNGL